MSETNKEQNNLSICKAKESKRQYLQFIQDMITMHNTNYFQIKNFTITIIAAVYGIFVANTNLHSVVLGCFNSDDYNY